MNTLNKVSHFSPFTILAHTRPISFTVADLSVTPKEVNSGESVTISIRATNTGDLTISHKVTLRIDNVVEAAKDVTLDGGDSQIVTFTTAKDAAGTYTVTVDCIPSGTFAVKTAGALIPVTAISVNWGLIGSIIAGCIIVGLLVYFFVWRKRG